VATARTASNRNRTIHSKDPGSAFKISMVRKLHPQQAGLYVDFIAGNQAA
jgi:hypothetical protein